MQLEPARVLGGFWWSVRPGSLATGPAYGRVPPTTSPTFGTRPDLNYIYSNFLPDYFLKIFHCLKFYTSPFPFSSFSPPHPIDYYFFFKRLVETSNFPGHLYSVRHLKLKEKKKIPRQSGSVAGSHSCRGSIPNPGHRGGKQINVSLSLPPSLNKSFKKEQTIIAKPFFLDI